MAAFHGATARPVRGGRREQWGGNRVPRLGRVAAPLQAGGALTTSSGISPRTPSDAVWSGFGSSEVGLLGLSPAGLGPPPLSQNKRRVRPAASRRMPSATQERKMALTGRSSARRGPDVPPVGRCLQAGGPGLLRLRLRG